MADEETHLLTVTQPSVFEGIDENGSIRLSAPKDWPPCRDCGGAVHPGASNPGGVCGKCAVRPAPPSGVAPAGIVKTRDDLILDTMEGHVDFADGYQKKFFEGEALSPDETDRRFRELAGLARAITARVADLGVKVVGAFPELQGLGARFVAFDREQREYKIDLHLDDEQRMRGDTFDAMLDGIDTVNTAEKAIRQARAEYLENERLEKLGIVRGRKAS